MSPLLPKGRRPWTDDPGHIHDVPTTPPMPDEQEQVGVDIPPEEIEVLQAVTEEREPHGEAAPVPDPAEVEVPRALAQEIRRAMKRYPQRRSAAIPALWAVQRRYGWCTPEGIEQAAAVMERDPWLPASRSRASTTSSAWSPRASTRSWSAPTSAAGCAAPTGCSSASPRRPESTARAPPRTARSSSAASSASAPATSRRWPRSTSATTARSPRRTPTTAVEQLRRNSKDVASREAARGPRRRRRQARASRQADLQAPAQQGHAAQEEGLMPPLQGRGDPAAVPQHRRARARFDPDLSAALADTRRSARPTRR